MKILFITDLYPVKQSEINTPRTLHNFVLEWTKQGHEVDVIKPNFIFNSWLRGKPFYKTSFYEYEGVRVFNVNYWTPFWFDITKKLEDKMHRCLEAWQNNCYASTHPHIHTSKTSILASDYDVILAHMPSGIIFANKLGTNVNLVCGVHCSDIEVLTNPLYKFYFRKQLKNAYKKAKKIACRSFVLQKKFNELMPELAEKTFVAASGVPANREQGKGNRSQLTILTCANLIKRKNIDKLILAVNELEGFDLKIIGSGKESKKLQLLSRSGIPARHHVINFLGQLPHEQVFEEMQKADIFVLPSVNETFGMVYLEAMASGCITVCSQNDGVDGIIQDGKNGFLTEPTVEGIKSTLLRIKNSQNLEQILENAQTTIKEYSMENCAKKYIEAIK